MAARSAPRRLHETVEAGANELLRHLSLLFVPAGVGIVAAAGSGSGHWLAILASLVVSTLLTLAVTALILRRLAPEPAPPPKDGDAGPG